MTDLDRLLELARKATPGPWEEYGTTVMLRRWDAEGEDWVGLDFNDADDAYVAACDPDTIIGLIERVKKAEEVMDAARNYLDRDYASDHLTLRMALRHYDEAVAE